MPVLKSLRSLMTSRRRRARGRLRRNRPSPAVVGLGQAEGDDDLAAGIDRPRSSNSAVAAELSSRKAEHDVPMIEISVCGSFVAGRSD